MERISTLVEKIRELNQRPEKSVIDIDLMMDYTKVIYADLLEWRNKIAFNEALELGEEQPKVQDPGEKPPITESAPDITGPSVELDLTSSNYEVQEPKPASSISFVPTSPTGADIRKHIGINDKYQFINELFGNSKDAYEEVISEINSFENEDDAIDWLRKSVYEEYNWEEDAEAVQSFYQVLRQFFNTR